MKKESRLCGLRPGICAFILRDCFLRNDITMIPIYQVDTMCTVCESILAQEKRGGGIQGWFLKSF